MNKGLSVKHAAPAQTALCFLSETCQDRRTSAFSAHTQGKDARARWPCVNQPDGRSRVHAQQVITYMLSKSCTRSASHHIHAQQVIMYTLSKSSCTCSASHHVHIQQIIMYMLSKSSCTRSASRHVHAQQVISCICQLCLSRAGKINEH